MEINFQDNVYLLSMIVGIVSSGIVGSLWVLATDDKPVFQQFAEPDLYTPLRVFAFVFSGPTATLTNALWYLFERPWLGIVLLIVGLGWSFFQGLFIITQIIM